MAGPAVSAYFDLRVKLEDDPRSVEAGAVPVREDGDPYDTWIAPFGRTACSSTASSTGRSQPWIPSCSSRPHRARGNGATTSRTRRSAACCPDLPLRQCAPGGDCVGVVGSEDALAGSEVCLRKTRSGSLAGVPPSCAMPSESTRSLLPQRAATACSA